jgi:enterochelin esterase-like enzyme
MSFTDFLTRLQTLESEPERAAAFAEGYVEANRGNHPIIEGNTAHFLYREKPGTLVGVAGEWNGMDGRRGLMTPLGGGLLHYSRDFEPDARLDYLFAEADVSLSDNLFEAETIRKAEVRMVRDPLNPRIGESGLGARSELAMPEYRRPEITLEQPTLKRRGRLRDGVLSSKAEGRDRNYTVYEPAGYSENSGPYSSIYFHDGGDYLTMGKAPTILDNLISGGAVPPVVAVFVPPVEREKEYNCDDRYVRFICDELVPAIESKYNLSANPAQRAIFGPSLGGLISLYIGSKRPDIFGLVGAQSSVVEGWARDNPFNARVNYAVQPRLPLRLHMVVGSYEGCFSTDEEGNCHDLLNPVRELRVVLERHGYPHRCAEYHQGHSWGLWRDQLADALVYFFSEEAAGGQGSER